MSNDNRAAAHNLDTSEGARAYVAEFFANQVGRHDFRAYITTRLAADFACALAQHLAARQPVGQDNPLMAYADSYRRMANLGSGRVSCLSVAYDIETNMAKHAAPPAQAVDLGPLRAALDAAEGLAVVCASVDGYSREEVAASGQAMRQQFADARALIDSKAVGNG